MRLLQVPCIRLGLIASFATSTLLGGGGLTAQADPQRVILISIDGLAAYHLEDEGLLLPNLRELIAEGVWAEGSMTVMPSVTHPSHATIITGVSPRVHGVIGNSMTNRETGESFPVTALTRTQAVRVRTLFDAAREGGLVTAALCWPETRGDDSIQFNLLHGHEELDKAEVDPALLQFLRDSGIPIDSYYDWSQDSSLQGFRDVLLAQSAARIIHRYRPHFLALHLLVTDSTQHTYGPQHYLSRAALTLADSNVGILRQAVREAGLEDQTTFVITADHGFHTVDHEVNIYPLLVKHELQERVRLHGGGWTIFLEKSQDFDPAAHEAILEAFFDDLMKLEGVKRVVRPEEFHELGYPRYEENPHVRGQYLILPDIDTFLTVDPGSTSTRRVRRTRPSHGHGYLPTHPRMYPSFILSGAASRKGLRIGVIRNNDIAPTVARILDIRLENVEGRVLIEALAP